MSQRIAAPSKLEVQIRGVVPQPYLGKRFRAPAGAVGSFVQRGYGELFAKLAEAGVAPAGHPFVIASAPLAGAMDIELGVPCAAPPIGGDLYAGTLPGGRVAVTTHRGRYDAIGPTYEALSTWIAANGHATAGPPREVYLNGPDDVAGPDEYLTELIWPIS
jgi:effector-binding domain-containing protein